MNTDDIAVIFILFSLGALFLLSYSQNATPMNYSVLPSDLNPECLPKHVAVIMDGNGRWANQRGLPRVAGHRQGAKTLKELLRCCKDWGIGALTAYAFSTENWRRPTAEVDFLMVLFEKMLRKELKAMHKEGVRVRFLGDLSALSPVLLREMTRATLMWL